MIAAAESGQREAEKIMFFRVKLLALALIGATSAAMAQGPVAGDPKAGEIVFQKCAQCHRIGPDATNFYGPELNGLVGRKAGSAPGYHYSKANLASGKIWDAATLSAYLRQPQHEVPDTYMTFAGLKNERDIANVIAFLAQFDAKGQKTPAP